MPLTGTVGAGRPGGARIGCSMDPTTAPAAQMALDRIDAAVAELLRRHGDLSAVLSQTARTVGVRSAARRLGLSPSTMQRWIGGDTPGLMQLRALRGRLRRDR